MMGGAMNLATALLALRDLPEVQGSFFMSERGALLARDMPAFFTDDLVGEVAVRLLRLADTFGSEGTSVQSFVIRYSEYLVFVRLTPQGALSVLATPGVNMAALRMGASLVARQLSRPGDGPDATTIGPAPGAAPAFPPSGWGALPAMPSPSTTSSSTISHVTAPPPAPPAEAPRTGIKWRGSTMPRRS